MILCVGLVVPSACTEDNAADVEATSDGLRINLSTLSTRSVPTPGVTDLNENLIKTVDLFYHCESSSSAEYIRLGRYSFDEPDGTASISMPLQISLKEKIFGTGSNGTCKFYAVVNVPDSVVTSAIDSANSASLADLKKLALDCSSFASTEPVDGITGKQESFPMDGESTATYAGLTATTTVDIDLTRAVSKIQVFLKLADSVTVNGATWVPVSSATSQGSSMGKIAISNGVKKGYLNTDYQVTADDFYPEASVAFDDKARDFYKSEVIDDSTYYSHDPYYTCPMTWEDADSFDESHPSTMTVEVDWATGAGNAAQTKRSFYSLPINALADDERTGDFETYKFKRNMYYRILFNIDAIGNETEDTPTEISGKYYVMPWKEISEDYNLEALRYLVVQEDSVEVFNKDTCSIPYVTSHECEIVNIIITRPNVSEEIATIDTVFDADMDPVVTNGEVNGNPTTTWTCQLSSSRTDIPNNDFAFTLDGKNVTMTHTLVNKTSSSVTNYDYVPYYITLTVRHSDDTTFYEDIKIVQYPMMYVIAHQNADYDPNFDASTNPPTAADSVNDHTGYVYVNGQGGEDNYGGHYTGAGEDYGYYADFYTYSSGSEQKVWTDLAYVYGNDKYDYTLGVVRGITNGTKNKNPNRYIINPTAFQGEVSYVIGDPRKSETDTLIYSDTRNGVSYSGGWSIRSSYLTDNDGTLGSGVRNLQNYHATDDATRTKSMVAPSFMIASSYGSTSDVKQGNATKRCASYQEEGYPAGRWRVPTEAEVRYMVELSAEGKIPMLFGESNNLRYYWTAHGKLGVEGNTVTNETLDSNSYRAWVRCVYDTWYWGSGMVLQKNSTTDKYDFTWGDI